MSNDETLEALAGEGPPSAARLITALGEARAADRELREAAKAYEEDRCRLFRETLKERGLAWCSWRHHAVPEADVRLMLEQDRHTTIHLTCKDCLIEALLAKRELEPIRRDEHGAYVRLETDERVWTGHATDWSDPPGVPHPAVEALGLPPKVEIIRRDNEGYDARVGYDETRDRYRHLR